MASSTPMMPTADEYAQQQMPTFVMPPQQLGVPYQPAVAAANYMPMSGSYMATLNANSGTGGMQANLPGRNRIEIDKSKLKDLREVLKKAREDGLETDFEALKAMTLLDVPELLDHLYSVEFMIKENPMYALNILFCMYRDKYADMFEKYPSLSTYVTFIIAILTHQSERVLKMYCRTNERVECGKNFNLKFNLKASSLKFNNGVNKRKNAKNAKNVKRQQKPEKPTHPFFSTSYYLAHTSIFSIGCYFKFCSPTDFIGLFTNLDTQQIATIVIQNQKAYNEGIQATFKIPCLASLNVRTYQSYEFCNVDGMERFARIITDYTSVGTDQEPVSFGRKRKMEMLDVKDGSKYSENIKFSDESYYFAFITNCGCVATDKNVMNIKAYSNTIFKLPKEIMDINDESEKRMWTDENREKLDEKKASLIQWYTKHDPEYLKRYNDDTEDEDGDDDDEINGNEVSETDNENEATADELDAKKTKKSKK